MEINNFLREAIGENEKGKTKVMVTAVTAMMNPETGAVRTLLSRTMEQPIFNITKRGRFIDIYLEFRSDLDIELRMLQKILLKYENTINETDEKAIEIPVCNISIAPHVYEGKFYLACINPITWSLQPKVDGGKNVVIRVVYEEEAIGLYETSDDEMKQGEVEANREFENEMAYYDNLEKKLDEQENAQFDYEENMNY